jgi:manganese/zinc/iron transport system ATP- binding protein
VNRWALQVNQLSVIYKSHLVLDCINFEIPEGVIVGIIGPNGAGKTTLIKSILGLIKPIRGTVNYFGKSIAYVPQRESVDWDFPITVRELVLMGRYGHLGLCKRPTKDDHDLVNGYLGMLDLAAYADRQINELSGGQQQRAFIARALAQQADILFLDEPFAGIDMSSEATIMQILKTLQVNGKTIFVVHHDLNTVPHYFNWMILLNTRLLACGHVKETFTDENLQSAYGKGYSLFNSSLRK